MIIFNLLGKILEAHFLPSRLLMVTKNNFCKKMHKLAVRKKSFYFCLKFFSIVKAKQLASYSSFFQFFKEPSYNIYSTTKCLVLHYNGTDVLSSVEHTLVCRNRNTDWALCFVIVSIWDRSNLNIMKNLGLLLRNSFFKIFF